MSRSLSPSSPSFTRAAGLACAALALAAGCGGAAPAAPAAPAAAAPEQGPSSALIGAAAPELTAEVVSGEGPATLQDARGKVVIVDFWATYCLPCRRSFPEYQALVDRHRGEVAVLAVALDAPEDVSKEQLVAFADEAGVRFRILWDKDQSAVKAYNPRRMPTAFIVDRGGVVRHVHAGYQDGEEATISREIEALLGAAASPPPPRPPAAPAPAAPAEAQHGPRDDGRTAP
jgi:thiol-disulfide isomerase/thioredoxin